MSYTGSAWIIVTAKSQTELNIHINSSDKLLKADFLLVNFSVAATASKISCLFLVILLSASLGKAHLVSVMDGGVLTAPCRDSSGSDVVR